MAQFMHGQITLRVCHALHGRLKSREQAATTHWLSTYRKAMVPPARGRPDATQQNMSCHFDVSCGVLSLCRAALCECH
ncbi:uncharacterized protein B0I36DRAFT_314734 [Microdochium trichocladiopsis]|uniref:Uncharacterized protein n=1 Tax=Microdochium trichocladiopsis TaxID=1682393 RepID=A0A9P8YGW6_9PEZI|nr:uncharacterized protein B0I36DRAFT_314734 [Microdochium trichocladiopsis]KAH7037749.1 hypothetical protein B0I36DRAFT_314734 [Microdochium trichocladiopsis]